MLFLFFGYPPFAVNYSPFNLPMPYIIDGHNLIPKITGFSLEDLDDEQRLVEMLVDFCRLSRKRAEVYFYNAPPGQPRARNFGNLSARYIRAGTTADQAIQAKLTRLGRTARNWTVVSSDREIQAAARRVKAKVIPSEKFARIVQTTLDKGAQESPDLKEAALNPEELEDWLNLFGQAGDEDDLTN